MTGRGTLTRNDRGQYVPFVSRALNNPALARALAGKPLHARIRKLGRAALGHSTAAIDLGRMYWGKVAKRRRQRKAARATRRKTGRRPRYTRTGPWRRTKRAMSSRSWRK